MREPTQAEHEELYAAYAVLKKYVQQPAYLKALADTLRSNAEREPSGITFTLQVENHIRLLFANDYPPPLPLQPEPPTLSELVSQALDADIMSRETLPPVNLGSFAPESPTMPSPRAARPPDPFDYTPIDFTKDST